MFTKEVSTSLVLLMCSLGAACDRDTSNQHKPAQATSAEAPRDKLSPEDLEQHCQALCAKASACGTQKATAKAGDEYREVADLVRRNEAKTTARCVADCARDSGTVRRSARWMRAATSCEQRQDCHQFESCLTAVAARIHD